MKKIGATVAGHYGKSSVPKFVDRETSKGKISDRNVCNPWDIFVHTTASGASCQRYAQLELSRRGIVLKETQT